ncbi:MAG: undecaprenyl-diphosphate phosphatase [Spirochaetaceae bacterium]|jgi:undecaprenyl-diphosphatase|nr:undecaprenyl-diphosphate phosphatase [Spirochaetaceae bacterium]
MSFIEAVILGAVQGVTEFLPVSSSGHLVLLQTVFGISEPVLLFDTMVHVGTLGAVFVVLWQDILAILRRIVQPMTAFLVLATIPAVIAALILKDHIETAFSSGVSLGFAFLFTAFALLTAEFLSRRGAGGSIKTETRTVMTWFDALVIGLCQAVAIVPGVSRSGLTLSGGLSRRLDRGLTARFSFLLSIPAILGALVLQVKDLAGGMPMGGIGPGPLAAGTLTAALVGFFAVNFMLKIVKERSLRGFAVYVAALGVLVLIDQFGTHLFF